MQVLVLKIASRCMYAIGVCNIDGKLRARSLLNYDFKHFRVDYINQVCVLGWRKYVCDNYIKINSYNETLTGN